MPFNINTFKSEIADYGYLQNNKFQVYVTPPPVLIGSSLTSSSPDGQITVATSSVTQRLLMRAQDAVAPGINLALSEVNRFGSGIAQKYPFNATSSSNLSLTFICDGYGTIWQFWYQWLRSIFQFSGVDSGRGAIFNSSGTYLTKYKSDYSTVISLNIYDNYGKLVQTNNYTQAFPYGINDVRLSWNTDNQLLLISVALAFTDFTIVSSELNTIYF